MSRLSMNITLDRSSYARSGAIAGAASTVVFAAVHALFISDIWWSLLLMMAAGGVCGLCLGWSYRLLFDPPEASSWLRYNMLYVAMFALLGLLSVLLYEPVTTLAAVVAANEPPSDLFGQAMPMTVLFTLASAILLGKLYGRRWSHYGAILLTCIILVLLLGLNVSAIGLVDVPRDSLYLIFELFGLIFVLNAVYAVLFIALERKSLLGKKAGNPS